ncbi:hypothetical protein QJS10_CPB04g00917 [Acorus calamus]|uniref:DUF4283 domain-containing protein n=1 Tax=Acorus calamus TaxID=4465 RepID=A0AAV9F0M2_ACOCL|nr:hypothetical protein QJS10_CPB04g00917 [Acorus calamus]
MLGRSILVFWEGQGNRSVSELVEAMSLKWTDISFSQSWWLSRGRLVVRLESTTDRDFILHQGSLQVQGGRLTFHRCLFTSGSAQASGELCSAYLRGVPLVWRSEDVIQNVVEPFGYLVYFEEVEMCSELFPLIKVKFWPKKEVTVPAEIGVSLGGWKVRVEVKLEAGGKRRSFAETVSGGRDGAASVLGCRTQALPLFLGVDLPPLGLVPISPLDLPERLGDEDRTRGNMVGVDTIEATKSNTGVPGTQVDKSLAQATALALCTSTDRGKGQGVTRHLLQGMHGDRQDVHMAVHSGLGLGSHSSSSEPSIHNELGLGSWAMFVDEKGKTHWTWNSDAGLGDELARRAIFESPPLSGAHESSGASVGSPSVLPMQVVRLKSVVVGNLNHTQFSREDSSSSRDGSIRVGVLHLESGSFSDCREEQVEDSSSSPICSVAPSRQSLVPLEKEHTFVSSSVAEEVGSDPREATGESPTIVAKLFLGSPGCSKGVDVGVIIQDRQVKGRFKSLIVDEQGAEEGEAALLDWRVGTPRS